MLPAHWRWVHGRRGQRLRNASEDVAHGAVSAAVRRDVHWPSSRRDLTADLIKIRVCSGREITGLITVCMCGSREIT